MERQLTYLLRQANSAVRAAIRRALTDLDLTPVQSTVLHLIAATAGSSPAELSRRMHVTPQTMHKLVTDLEHRSLLTLGPRAGHGRILATELTDQGRRMVTDADAHTQSIEERMTAGLDQRQRRQLLDLLQHCITALDMPSDDPQSSQC
jgi:DNA-binding MarR family transcriptional regulator